MGKERNEKFDELVEEILFINSAGQFENLTEKELRDRLTELGIKKIFETDPESIKNQITTLRNDLYRKLPSGEVDAFSLIKVIEDHISKLDKLGDEL